MTQNSDYYLRIINQKPSLIIFLSFHFRYPRAPSHPLPPRRVLKEAAAASKLRRTSADLFFQGACHAPACSSHRWHSAACQCPPTSEDDFRSLRLYKHGVDAVATDIVNLLCEGAERRTRGSTRALPWNDRDRSDSGLPRRRANWIFLGNFFRFCMERMTSSSFGRWLPID